ncbi:hypothetical protein PSZ80_23725, partial [Shigella sonnei]|nr:hypothetical protein [Shigella sonnei]
MSNFLTKPRREDVAKFLKKQGFKFNQDNLLSSCKFRQTNSNSKGSSKSADKVRTASIQSIFLFLLSNINYFSNIFLNYSS